MRAMILAAGVGKRMGTLTTHVPKPLIRIKEKFLIEYAIANLVQAGLQEIVINVHYHAEQIKTALNDGRRYGAEIVYSEEKELLETGGGICHALHLLGNDPFLVTSADIITDYPFERLPAQPAGLAHLIMVDNPHYHANGDFGLADGIANRDAHPKLTFGNIGVYRKELFAGHPGGCFPLNQLLFPAIEKSQITGEHYQGRWFNIGSPDDLLAFKQTEQK